MEKLRYMISDAADMVHVETHVLRYWEEELELAIPRNEMGHRYYTRENIKEFQKIKELKEQGYQLKAIRMILHNGKLEYDGVKDCEWYVNTMDETIPSEAAYDPMLREATSRETMLGDATMQREATSRESMLGEVAMSRDIGVQRDVTKLRQERMPSKEPATLSPEERMAQFRELMSDIVGQAIAQNNEALSETIGKDVQERVLKEMNYLMREQDAVQEERYRKLDAAIRGSIRRRPFFAKKEKKEKGIV